MSAAGGPTGRLLLFYLTPSWFFDPRVRLVRSSGRFVGGCIQDVLAIEKANNYEDFLGTLEKTRTSVQHGTDPDGCSHKRRRTDHGTSSCANKMAVLPNRIGIC